MYVGTRTHVCVCTHRCVCTLLCPAHGKLSSPSKSSHSVVGEGALPGGRAAAPGDFRGTRYLGDSAENCGKKWLMTNAGQLYLTKSPPTTPPHMLGWGVPNLEKLPFERKGQDQLGLPKPNSEMLLASASDPAPDLTSPQ